MAGTGAPARATTASSRACSRSLCLYAPGSACNTRSQCLSSRIICSSRSFSLLGEHVWHTHSAPSDSRSSAPVYNPSCETEAVSSAASFAQQRWFCCQRANATALPRCWRRYHRCHTERGRLCQHRPYHAHQNNGIPTPRQSLKAKGRSRPSSRFPAHSQRSALLLRELFR